MGELLRGADLAARRMLTDVDPATATARLRSWAEVVEAGAQAWRAIPAVGPHRGGVDADIDALRDVAVGVHRLTIAHGADDRSVSAWIRRAVEHEITRSA